MEEIDKIREEALFSINIEASQARGRFTTLIPGQDLIHQEKYKEALCLLDNSDSQCPFIEEEALYLNKDKVELAKQIKTLYEHFRKVSVLIEVNRVLYRNKLAFASSIEDISSIKEEAIKMLKGIKPA